MTIKKNSHCISNLACLATAIVISTIAAQAQGQAVGVPIENGVDNHDNDTGINNGVPILIAPADKSQTSAGELIDKSARGDKADKSENGKAKYPNYPPCTSWIDDTVPTKIAVLCIHGLGLNSDAFRNLARHLEKQGIAVYAIDVRGFGSWLKNKDNDQLNFRATVADIGATIRAIKSANKEIPLFILGESMGGAIAIKAASEYQASIAGLISSAPSGERYATTKTDLKVAMELLTAPSKQFDIGKSVIDQATKNEQLRQIWSTDPLNRQDLSAEELVRFQSFMNKFTTIFTAKSTFQEFCC